MSHGYRAVQWNPFKLAFDRALAVGVLVFLAFYAGVATITQATGQSLTPVQIAIRASGACAFTLLTFILMIGPLARLNHRFKPLLYNRRHLGVTCFLLALAHAGLVVLWYHSFSEVNPLVSLLISNPRYNAIQGFPFESLGLVALAVLMVMAATSHDFWNANLGPIAWKSIHMAVYAAYGLLVGHIMLGAVQSQRGLEWAALVGAGAGTVALLHLATGLKERALDAKRAALDAEGWIAVGPGAAIAEACAKIITPPTGERIAVFRDGQRIYALSNLCRHQGGPLGEGRIVDGCVVCPWHGFQYRPEDGRSPPPFTEQVATYQTKIVGSIVYVDPNPLPPGTPTPPSLMGPEQIP